jgi:hypothetical protein
LAFDLETNKLPQISDALLNVTMEVQTLKAELQAAEAKIDTLRYERDALQARIDAAEKQEPVAYGEKLGTHYQSAWCIPPSVVHPWIKTTTPLSHPAIPPEGMMLVPVATIKVLRYQTQCDEDGTLIAVSRQAVDELLSAVPAKGE